MTQSQSTGIRSMRYSIDEVLSAMLGTITRSEFTDDTQRLGEVFKTLAGKHSLLAPYAAVGGEANFSAILQGALKKLVDKKLLQHESGKYTLPPQGRAACITSKRTLFKATDMEQLEGAARDFEAQLGA